MKYLVLPVIAFCYLISFSFSGSAHTLSPNAFPFYIESQKCPNPLFCRDSWSLSEKRSSLLERLETPAPHTISMPKRPVKPEVPAYLKARQTIRAYCLNLVRTGNEQRAEATSLACRSKGTHWLDVEKTDHQRFNACISASGVPHDKIDDLNAGGTLHRRTFADVLARDADLMTCRKTEETVRPVYQKAAFSQQPLTSKTDKQSHLMSVSDRRSSINFSLRFDSAKRKRPDVFKMCRRYGYRAATEIRRAKQEYSCPKSTSVAVRSDLWFESANFQTLLCLGAATPHRYIIKAQQQRENELNKCIQSSRHGFFCHDFADKMKAMSRFARRSGCERLANRWRESRAKLVGECLRSPHLARKKQLIYEKAVKQCALNRGSDNPGEALARGIISGVFGLINNRIHQNNSPGTASNDKPPTVPKIICSGDQILSGDKCLYPVPDVNRDIVRKDQMCLNVLGYNAGPADGLRGRMTRAAVRQFLQTHNLFVQDNLYVKAREHLYRACNQKLAEMSQIEEAIAQISADKAEDNSTVDHGSEAQSPSIDASNPASNQDLLTCLTFDDWNIYIQKKIKPPLPLCKAN